MLYYFTPFPLQSQFSAESALQHPEKRSILIKSRRAAVEKISFCRRLPFLSTQITGGLQFVDCTFTDCSLDSCTLRHCDFSGCVFLRCRVSALKAETVQMKFGEFKECVLTGVNWSLLQPAGRFSEPISRM